MAYDAKYFLELFNDGELDVEKYFGSFQSFFSILDKRGLMSEIDPINGSYSSDWQNEYLIWLWQTNKEKFNYWVEKILSDVEFDESGNAYLIVRDRGELARLFCDGRDYSRDSIQRILSNDSDWYEYFSDSTDDLYRDVIEELNKENLERLKEYIIDTLMAQNLSPETTLMEDIANEQGHSDFWTITPENVARIIDDEESMKSLLNDELGELKMELYSVHGNAYNSAYEEEIYDDVWKELDDYFEGIGIFETRPHQYKKDTQVEYFKIKVRDFYGFLIDYLSENKGYGNSGTIEYYGSLLGLMEEGLSCLSPRFSDYPDSRLVDKYVNEYFKDYI